MDATRIQTENSSAPSYLPQLPTSADDEGERKQALPMIPPDQLVRTTTLLGVGRMGSTYAGKAFGQPAALKVIPLCRHSATSDMLISAIENEIIALHRLAASSVLVQCLGVVRLPFQLIVARELAPYGTLRDLLYDRGIELSPSLMAAWGCDCAQAIAHLHSNKIIHGDLHAGRFLVFSSLRLKLTDCGVARQQAPNFERSSVSFLAPDAFQHALSPSSDIFSFSMTMVQIFSRSLPQHLLPPAEQVHHALQAIPLPTESMKMLQTLLLQCCSSSSDPPTGTELLRPTADELVLRMQAIVDSLGGDVRGHEAQAVWEAAVRIHMQRHQMSLSLASYCPHWSREVLEEYAAQLVASGLVSLDHLRLAVHREGPHADTWLAQWIPLPSHRATLLNTLHSDEPVDTSSTPPTSSLPEADNNSNNNDDDNNNNNDSSNNDSSSSNNNNNDNHSDGVPTSLDPTASVQETPSSRTAAWKIAPVATAAAEQQANTMREILREEKEGERDNPNTERMAPSSLLSPRPPANPGGRHPAPRQMLLKSPSQPTIHLADMDKAPTIKQCYTQRVAAGAGGSTSKRMPTDLNYKMMWALVDREQADVATLSRVLSDMFMDIDKANPDKNHETLMHSAARWGHVEVLHILFANRSRAVTIRDDDGRTPLLHAAMEGRVEAMKILLEHRAAIDAVDDELRYTSLHWTAHRGHVDAAKLLLENKCQLEKQSIYMDTPLHCAARWGHVKVAKLLLDHGANVDAKDYGNNTPLMIAEAQGNKDMVTFLNRRGTMLGWLLY